MPLAILLIWGCEQGIRENPRLLPTQLSMLVETTTGESLSVVVELTRNLRDQLDLRIAEGNLFYDGRHIWEFREGEMMDRVGGDKRILTPGTLQLLDRLAILLKQNEQLISCDTSQWPEWSEIPTPPGNHPVNCQPATDLPALRYTYPGPNGGFLLTRDGTLVRVRLPQDADTEGQIVLRDIDRILGVRWVQDPSEAARPTLERLYRGRAVISAPELAVTVDGDLEEWAEAEAAHPGDPVFAPLVVEREWHLESGGESWQGANDISFSVAAARTVHQQVCLAGRARDDDREEKDAIYLNIGAQHYTIPLAPLMVSEAWQGQVGPIQVAIARDWYGARYELCLTREIGDRVPFSMAWYDADAGQEATLLTTAPSNGTVTPPGWLIREL